MFLRTDQFISSERIEILIDLLALSWAGRRSFFRPTCVLHVSWKSPMAYVAAAWRHWGSPLAIGGLGFFVGTWKLLSCLFRVVITLTKCWILLDGVFSLMVRRWSSATSFRFARERASKKQTNWKAVVVHFNRLISVRPLEASSNQIFLVVRSPEQCLLGHTILNLPCDEK